MDFTEAVLKTVFSSKTTGVEPLEEASFEAKASPMVKPVNVKAGDGTAKLGYCAVGHRGAAGAKSFGKLQQVRKFFAVKVTGTL